MFYVGGSFIFKVLEGQRIDEFRDKFLKGSKVRFGEALLGILMILGVPSGVPNTSIWEEKGSFFEV